MQLKDVMTPGVEVIAPEASLYEAAQKMCHLDVGPLPVCDGERLVGMVALGDLAMHAENQPVAAEVLEQVSEPGKAGRK
jgi:CBS-domain-containing membrane protein